MKYITTVLIGLLFIAPSFSYAAFPGETRHALIMELIGLIQQEIATLQSQLVAQSSATPALGATVVATTTPDTVTAQITTITKALGTTMPETLPFDYFFGAVQKTNAQPYVQVVTNAPVTISGNIESSSEIVGDTVFRNTKDKAYTYRIVLNGDSSDITLTPSVGDPITKTVSL